MKVAIGTFGCKLNQAETESLARRLLEAGHSVVSGETGADVYILNSCTVTHTADGKCRAWLRQVHRRNPGARLVVTGCYAQRQPEELARMDGVSAVAGNDNKPGLLSLLKLADVPGNHPYTGGDAPVWRTRTFIKVQDGCSRLCTYCIVPLVRGPEKSLPADDVVAEVKRRISEGYREVVLTGTEVGDYRNGIGLKDLIRRILAETDVSRLRLSSLQPQEVSPGLLATWCDGRLCPHFHLSLQSGSDSVLRRMRRGYSTADYRRIVLMIRDNVPDVAITTDIIVGFPGETEAEFTESYDFCRELKFARIHVFPYSSRPETEARWMPGQVEAKVKKERSRKMLSLARESSEIFRKQFIGREMPVLWETGVKGVWTGFTGNYIKVFTISGNDLTNMLLPVKLAQMGEDGVWG